MCFHNLVVHGVCNMMMCIMIVFVECEGVEGVVLVAIDWVGEVGLVIVF